MVKKIKSLDGYKRLSSQQLLQQIYDAMDAGETKFEIDGSGQHDIGGPLWDSNDKKLKFTIKNPGQRVGSMCMDKTTIIVEGSAPADVGWLNAGGTIIVKGDGGDTTAHCSAAGKIYIGGRVGARSGSLMKHDPKFEPPEFWVLKNTGSFSFEFMGGGIGVICGHDSDQFNSVMGERPCVGMVGGVVYVRGDLGEFNNPGVEVLSLDDDDIKFLSKGMPNFLKHIGRETLEKKLTNWKKWQKIVPLSYDKSHKKKTMDVIGFRQHDWVEGGIFSDVFPDEGVTIGLVDIDQNRLRYPVWEEHFFLAPCEYNCPVSIPSQKRFNLLREGKTREAYEMIFDYTPFPGTVCGEVCPNMCMSDCSRKHVDTPVDIKGLGRVEVDWKPFKPEKERKEHVAIIGAGVGGLTAAWHLRTLGIQVTVFEKDTEIGGKLAFAVSRERLSTSALLQELERFERIGITFKLGQDVDKKAYNKIKKDFDSVVLATGAYQPKVPPWEGSQNLIHSVDLLKKVNKGEDVTIGKKVVVIGAGNTGMDVIFGAYNLGAKEVTAVDVQTPRAFKHEIERAKSLGAKIKYPIFTKEISEKGVTFTDGSFIEADTVVLAIGEAPILDYIDEKIETDRGYLKIENDYHLADNVYAIGDITKLGLLADAIGEGREVASIINGVFTKKSYSPKTKKLIDKNNLVTSYFEYMGDSEIEGGACDYERCISCGSCRDCHICEKSCPENAITRIVNQEEAFEYTSDPQKCIGCSICSSVCPCGIWVMHDNSPSFPGGH
jgi:putative selenate reductase